MGEESVKNDYLVSEWNQQAAFDSVFHQLSYKCRYLQENQDVIRWYHVLRSLVTHCWPIFNKDEKKIITDDLKKITMGINTCESTRDEKIKSSYMSALYGDLCEFENKFRDLFHLHNPLINKKQEEDFTEF